MRVFKLTFLFIAMSTALLSYAGVNYKNGNFYIAYTDIIVPGGGNDLKIVRTYNSKSTDSGWFGVGWGSDYETNLIPSADGSVIVYEHGSGARTRFTPKQQVNPNQAAAKIVEAIRKKASVSDKYIKDLEVRLAKDATLRQAYARKYGVKSNLAVGTKLFSNSRGLQELHKLKKGYKRVFTDGKVEYFNEEGKLSKITTKTGYYVSLAYDKSKRLKSVKDSQAKQLFFDWYANGRVKNVWSVGDKKTKYKYDNGDLVESTDVGGNTYKYSYDGNHNMTKVSYKDGSSLKIDYHRKTQFVSKVTQRSGEWTKYDYDSNPKNPDFHYWTTVTKKSSKGKESKNKYEYEIKTKPDGSQYTYRIFTSINGLDTETIYSECCSLPLKIKRGKQVTSFEYNKDGLLTKKSSTKGEYIQIEYDNKFKKISRVVNNNSWTKFEYNKEGNLNKAINSKGKSVLLVYDRKGRITKMIDHNKKTKKKRSLTFKYNALGKPVEIAMSKVGKINVSYDNYGEIKKVESKSGQRMALQVTQAFQSLLAIVKPAGVNLNL